MNCFQCTPDLNSSRRVIGTARYACISTLIGLFVTVVAGCSVGSNDRTAEEAADNSGKTSLPLSADDTDYVPVPNVGKVHKSCVHGLRNGDIVDEQGAIHSVNGEVRPAFAACAFPEKRTQTVHAPNATGNVIVPYDTGWQLYGAMTTSVPMAHFGATFHVPAAPSVSTSYSTVFLFPAMQAGHNIIQPVLQYGPSQAGGGSYWTAGCWYGGPAWGDNYYSTPLRGVTTGEEIRGEMDQHCGPAGCQTTVSLRNTNDSDWLTIGTDTNLDWTWWVGGALEVYGIDNCGEYPSTYDNFYNFFLQDRNGNGLLPNWSATSVPDTACDNWINIINWNLIEVHYNGN